MAISDVIKSIENNLSNAYAMCLDKGATMPSSKNLTNLAECIASITGGEPVIPPSEGYVTDGLIAHFSGEDALVDGAWVDRINGHTFTANGNSTLPVHDAVNKLYNQQELGGMISDFILPTGSNYTFEVVTRDIRNAQSSNMSSYYATIVGCQIEKWTQTAGGVHLYRLSSSDNQIQFGEAQNGLVKISRNEFVDGALDTFTQVPGQALYRNGIKVANAGENPADRKVGLFRHYEGTNAGTYRGKGKIHAIRLYDRQLTMDEVAQNHAEDIRIYGA